jgi:hypothetical protein
MVQSQHRTDLGSFRYRTDGQDEMCLVLWREMIGKSSYDQLLCPLISDDRSSTHAIAGYEARQKLLTYCTTVVNENLTTKRAIHVENEDLNRRTPVMGLFEEEVLVCTRPLLSILYLHQEAHPYRFTCSQINFTPNKA